MKTPDIRAGEALETVYTVNNPVEAELIKNLLLDDQIPCLLDGDHQAGFTGALKIGIVVRATDADLAHDILRRYHVEPKPPK